MVSTELVAIIVSGLVTFGTMIYKFGRLEGKITQQLLEHDRRLSKLEDARLGFHASV